MKIVGKPQRTVFTEEGYAEVTFLVKNYNHINICKELDKEQFYSIDLKVNRSKRSIESNNLFWVIVHDIAIKRNGRATSENEWEIYIEALERAGAKCEYYLMTKEGAKLLDEIEGVRLLKNMKQSRIVIDNKGNEVKQDLYKLFYGSSTFNTEEMSNLIAMALDMASQEGIDTTYYDNLKG